MWSTNWIYKYRISIFKELLPKNIVIVEGGDDKIIFSHVLSKICPSFFCTIKSAGGASKIYSIASILLNEDLKSIFLLDDDKEGKDAKKDIISKLKNGYNKDNVFTLKDLIPTLPDNSTLEDLLPIKFIKDFFDNEMGHEFEFDNLKPIIFQIKNQDENLKNNKEQLMSKKIKLSEKFISEFDNKQKLEENTPLLVSLVNAFVNKIQNN